MGVAPESKQEWLGLGGVVVLALVARAFRLGESSFWLDETASWWFASRPLGEIWGQIPFYEPHPPLFYSLLRGWLRLFGQSEFALRSLAALAGVMIVPVVYGIGRLAVRSGEAHRIGLLAAALAAVYPMQIRYAQDARPYTLLTLAVAILLLASLWIIANPATFNRRLLDILKDSGTRARAVLITVVLSCSAALWLHNTGIVLVTPLLAVVAILVVMQTGPSRQLMLNFLVIGATILILWLPNLRWILTGLSAIDEGFWVKVPGLRGVAYVMSELLGSAEIASGPESKSGLLVFTLFLLLTGTVALWRRGSAISVLFLVGAMAVPSGVALLVTYLITPIFISRVLLWIEIPAFVLVAANLLWLRSLFLRATLSATAVVFLAVIVATGWGREVKESWRDVARIILQEAGPQDLIVVANANAQVPILYYGVPQRTSATLLLFPDVFPLPMGQRGYPDGFFVRSTVDDSVLKRVRESVEESAKVWYVSRGRHAFDREEKIPGVLKAMRGSGIARVVNGESILLAEY